MGSESRAQVQRSLPRGETAYEHYPVQVTSTEFIKRKHYHRQGIVRPPELMIVGEARRGLRTQGRSATSATD